MPDCQIRQYINNEDTLDPITSPSTDESDDCDDRCPPHEEGSHLMPKLSPPRYQEANTQSLEQVEPCPSCAVRIKKLEVAYKTLQVENERLRADLAEATKERDEIERLRADLAEATTDRDAEASKEHDEIEHLRADLAEATKERDEIERLGAILAEKATKEHDEIERLRADLAEATKERDENERFRADLAEAAKERDENKRTNRGLTLGIDDTLHYVGLQLQTEACDPKTPARSLLLEFMNNPATLSTLHSPAQRFYTPSSAHWMDSIDSTNNSGSLTDARLIELDNLSPICAQNQSEDFPSSAPKHGRLPSELESCGGEKSSDQELPITNTSHAPAAHGVGQFQPLTPQGSSHEESRKRKRTVNYEIASADHQLKRRRRLPDDQYTLDDQTLPDSVFNNQLITPLGTSDGLQRKRRRSSPGDVSMDDGRAKRQRCLTDEFTANRCNSAESRSSGLSGAAAAQIESPCSSPSIRRRSQIQASTVSELHGRHEVGSASPAFGEVMETRGIGGSSFATLVSGNGQMVRNLQPVSPASEVEDSFLFDKFVSFDAEDDQPADADAADDIGAQAEEASDAREDEGKSQDEEEPNQDDGKGQGNEGGQTHSRANIEGEEQGEPLAANRTNQANVQTMDRAPAAENVTTKGPGGRTPKRKAIKSLKLPAPVDASSTADQGPVTATRPTPEERDPEGTTYSSSPGFGRDALDERINETKKSYEHFGFSTNLVFREEFPDFHPHGVSLGKPASKTTLNEKIMAKLKARVREIIKHISDLTKREGSAEDINLVRRLLLKKPIHPEQYDPEIIAKTIYGQRKSCKDEINLCDFEMYSSMIILRANNPQAFEALKQQIAHENEVSYEDKLRDVYHSLHCVLDRLSKDWYNLHLPLAIFLLRFPMRKLIPVFAVATRPAGIELLSRELNEGEVVGVCVRFFNSLLARARMKEDSELRLQPPVKKLEEWYGPGVP